MNKGPAGSWNGPETEHLSAGLILSMIKAARKAAANAELARAFADIFRAPTHEHGRIFAKNEQKDRECECVKRCGSAVRAKQCVALIIHVCEQEVITTKYEETVLCLLSGFTLETTQELLEFRGLNSYEETLSEGTFLRENID